MKDKTTKRRRHTPTRKERANHIRWVQENMDWIKQAKPTRVSAAAKMIKETASNPDLGAPSLSFAMDMLDIPWPNRTPGENGKVTTLKVRLTETEENVRELSDRLAALENAMRSQ